MTSSEGELSLGAEEPEAGPVAGMKVGDCCTYWVVPTADAIPSKGRLKPGVDGIAATVIGNALWSAVLANGEEEKVGMIAWLTEVEGY